MSVGSTVIIGAGHGGVQAAASLRDEGYDGTITLIDAQPHRPYQRPPLSKAYMNGEATPDSLVLRGDDFYTQKRIDLRLGARALGIDRAARRVTLADGAALAYDSLILATGARARPFAAPGHDLDGVALLRTLDDATALRARLDAARRVAVIGAGFIGLEFASVAAGLGREVTVVDIAPRVMARAASPLLSEAMEIRHRALGVTLRLGVGLSSILDADARAGGIRLADGADVAADLVLVGVGVLAEDALARDAGLALDDGVAVDGFLRTSDPAIFAIGDAASFPGADGRRMRLESVQNALDQARTVAKTIAVTPTPYASTPWFWSDQADVKLQIAGLARGVDGFATRGDLGSSSFSVFAARGGEVVAVESVNRPADHMAARRFLAGAPLSLAQAGDETYDLKAHAMRSVRRA